MLSIRLLAILIATISIGCLQTDPTGGKPNTETTLPEDNGRRAGATSSTNWPADIGNPHQIFISAKLGSSLVLTFAKKGESAEDPEYLPIQLAGTAIAYRATEVPVFKDPDTAVVTFGLSDSAVLSADWITKLTNEASDTIFLNINMISGTRSTWIHGIGYNKKTKMYFETDYSVQTRTLRVLYAELDTIRGVLDPNVPLPKPKLSGKSVLNFYIPGSPYFKSAQVDTLQLGPIPDGDYVLRLLRVTFAGANETGTEIESFEVQSTHIAPNINEYVFKPGALVFSYHMQSTLTLRPDWQR